MKDTETIGAIRVTRMIWTSTLLSLGAIFYCVNVCLFSGQIVINQILAS